MGVAVDQRSEVIDAVGIFMTIKIPNAATFPSGRVDRVRLHEDGRARIAARQACQRAIIHRPGSRLRIWIHRFHFSVERREPALLLSWRTEFCWAIRDR